jgi:hypothetical protein
MGQKDPIRKLKPAANPPKNKIPTLPSGFFQKSELFLFISPLLLHLQKYKFV